MEFPSFIDEDIIYNPMYWLLTAAAEFAIILGFKSQTLWNAEASMPFTSMLGVLAVIPVVSYFIVMKFRS